MTKFLFNIEPDTLRKIKREVKTAGFDSVASFLRKLIFDYFENKKK